MSTAKSRTMSAIALTIGLVFGLILSAGLLLSPGHEDNVALGASFFVMDDSAAGNTNADRAELPAIFIGQVIGRDGEHDIAEPDSGPFMVPVYSVDVETTLKGNADGRIRLGVVESEYSDDRGGGPIEIGERYLFAAIDDPDGVFTIDEGFGNIPIANDEEAANLIAEFEILIIDADSVERADDELIDDPCEELTVGPTIDLEPEKGKAGRTVRVTAKRLVRPEVGIWWKTLNNRLGVGEVDADCTMYQQVEIPRDAKPGRYEIIVIDARGLRADEKFHVIPD